MRHHHTGTSGDVAGRSVMRAAIARSAADDAAGDRVVDTVPPGDCDPWIRTLYDYWRQCHPAAGGLPGRQHIDPLAFAGFWPWVWMADIVGTPARFRFRLLGSEHVRLMKGEYTGLWIDTVLPPALCPTIHAGLDQAAGGTPAYSCSPSYVRYDRGAALHVAEQLAERLYLPLAQDGRGPDMVLALTIVHARPRPGGG